MIRKKTTVERIQQNLYLNKCDENPALLWCSNPVTHENLNCPVMNPELVRKIFGSQSYRQKNKAQSKAKILGLPAFQYHPPPLTAQQLKRHFSIR